MRNFYLFEEDSFTFVNNLKNIDLKPYKTLTFYKVNFSLDFIPKHISKVVIYENANIPLFSIPVFIKNVVLYGQKDISEINHLELETLKIYDNELPLMICNTKSLYLEKVSNIIGFPKNLEKLKIFDCPKINLDNLPFIKKLYLQNPDCNLDFLPSSLEKLKIKYNYKKPLRNLPNQLKTLKLEFRDKYVLDYLPNSIETLILKYDIQFLSIPQNLKFLEIHSNDCLIDIKNTQIQEIILNCPKIINLPHNLKKLTILSNLLEIDLPETLEELIIPEKSLFNQKLILPKNLKNLIISNIFNKKIIFNDKLLYFMILCNSKFNQEIKLPDSLLNLTIIGNFRYDYELVLPKKLNSFYLGSNSYLYSLITHTHNLHFGEKNITILKLVFYS